MAWRQWWCGVVNRIVGCYHCHFATVGVICYFGGLLEMMEFLAGSKAWMAEIEGIDLGLTGIEGWWGLTEGTIVQKTGF